MSRRLRKMPSSFNDACRTMDEAAAHIDLLESNALVQAKLLADTGRRVEELEKALQTAINIAAEAREEWDKAPEGMRAGKLLIALSDPTMKYRACITAMHSALTPSGAA